MNIKYIKDNSHLQAKSQILLIHWYCFNKVKNLSDESEIYWDYSNLKKYINSWEFDIYRWWINIKKISFELEFFHL